MDRETPFPPWPQAKQHLRPPPFEGSWPPSDALRRCGLHWQNAHQTGKFPRESEISGQAGLPARLALARPLWARLSARQARAVWAVLAWLLWARLLSPAERG